MLFTIIDSVLNVPQYACLEASPELCNKFLQFFIDKVVTTRALIPTPASDSSGPFPCQFMFEKFDIFLSLLEDVVATLSKHFKGGFSCI